MPLSTVEEVWACHEMFRRLKFPAKDIYVAIHKNILVGVQQGSKRFFINVGIPDCAPEVFEKQWDHFCTWVNAGKIKDDHLRKIISQSIVFSKTAELLAAILAKGFDPIWLEGKEP